MVVKILQQNICYKNPDIEELMTALLKQNPDVMLLSEFSPFKHRKSITERLKKFDYEIVMPKEYDSHKDNGRNKCVCMMAIKSTRNIQFELVERKEITLTLRYISGVLKFDDGSLLNIFFTHAPLGNRVEYKAEIIFSAYRFLQEYKDKNAFIAGDFNIALDGSTTMEKPFKVLYNETIDTHEGKEPTWEKKRLDYALASPVRGCTFVTVPLETNSDHKALLTEIKFNEL